MARADFFIAPIRGKYLLKSKVKVVQPLKNKKITITEMQIAVNIVATICV